MPDGEWTLTRDTIGFEWSSGEWLVSSRVVGPRTVKTLSRVRPLAFASASGEDRTEYEQLPIDEK